MRIHNTLGLAIAALGISIVSSKAQDFDVTFGSDYYGSLRPVVSFVEPFEIPVSPFSGINGYATADVGFHSAAVNDPYNNFYTLSGGANFEFILTAKDLGIEVWNDHGTGFMSIGDAFSIGHPIFDTHPVWNITTGAPGNVYSVSITLHDLAGIYADVPLTLSFTPVPESGTLALFLAGSAAALCFRARTTSPTR
jgi:hypothetical protein